MCLAGEYDVDWLPDPKYVEEWYDELKSPYGTLGILLPVALFIYHQRTNTKPISPMPNMGMGLLRCNTIWSAKTHGICKPP